MIAAAEIHRKAREWKVDPMIVETRLRHRLLPQPMVPAPYLGNDDLQGRHMPSQVLLP